MKSRDETEVQVMPDPGKDIRLHTPSPDMSVDQLVGCVQSMLADIGAARKATAAHYWWAGETLRMIRRKLEIKHGDWKKHVVETLKLSWPMVRTAQRIRRKQDSPDKCTGKTLRQAEAYKPRPSQESEKTVSADPPIKLVPATPADGLNDTSPETAASEKPKRPCKAALLEPEVQQRRLTATTLLHGDAVEKLKTIPDGTADVCLFDPPYPCIKRPYGTLTEDEWHDLIDSVLIECRRILKPQGSVVVVLQPNYEVSGRMRLWPWRCVVRAAEMWDDWGLVQDVYWFSPNALPCGGTQRNIGLLRTSIKWCVWLGRSDCYRNQEAVLKPPAAGTISGYCTANRKQVHSSGHRLNLDGFDKALTERGGVTPPNLLTVPIGGPNPQGHPAVTPYRLAEWWCQYVLPPGGVLVDPFCGSGTTLLAALNCGASQVIGIDKDECYLDQAKRRMCEAVAEEKTDWNSPAEQLWWKEYYE
ncbi:MAG: DNA-methyltransferase, partial [Pirellulaceae bacterium]